MTAVIEVVRGMSHPDELIEDLGRTFARVSSVTRGASNYELDVTSEYSPTAREVLAYLRDGEFMVLRLGMERVLVEDSPHPCIVRRTSLS